MAINLNDNIFVSLEATLLDAKWGPFESPAAAKAAVDPAYRSIGMFAIIAPPGGSASLYWYKDNINNLVLFSGNSSVQVFDVKDATVPPVPGETFFPPTGETDIIYVDKSTNSSYYWDTSSSQYVLSGNNVETHPSKTGSTPGTDSFPLIGAENIIYIANDTNISYIWNPALNNNNGDYEIISGAIKKDRVTYHDCTSGTENIYVVNTSTVDTNTVGDAYLIKFDVDNTGPSTLQMGTAPAVNLYNNKTKSELIGGDIRLDDVHLIVYTSENIFEILTIRPNLQQVLDVNNQTNSNIKFSDYAGIQLDNISFLRKGTYDLPFNQSTFLGVNGISNSVGSKAIFSGILPGMTSPVVLQANDSGTIGNSIVLYCEGPSGGTSQGFFDTITNIIGNSNQPVSLISGDGSQIPNAGETFTFSGGSNSSGGIYNVPGWAENNVFTQWSDLNGIYISTPFAVTPTAPGVSGVGMNDPEPGTLNYYIAYSGPANIPLDSSLYGIAYFLAPGNTSKANSYVDAPVDYWRLCVLADDPIVYFTNPSTDQFNFPLTGWVINYQNQFLSSYQGSFNVAFATENFGNSYGGISRLSLGYEDMWQAGIRYVFDGNGFVREASNCFDIIPNANFDSSQRFKAGSRWVLDNGDVYICTDSSVGFAVWSLQSSTGLSLQDVTTVSAITTDSIIVQDTTTQKSSTLNPDSLTLTNNSNESSLKNTNVNNTGVNLEFPNKAAGDYTIATTSDGYITDASGSISNDGKTYGRKDGDWVEVISNNGGGVTHFTANVNTSSGIDAYFATVTGVTAYNDGDAYLVRFTAGNTAADPTLQINSLGSRPLYKNNDGPLIGGDIWAGGEMLCIYNSTLNSPNGAFQCIGTSPNSLFAYVTNGETVPITKGKVVYAHSGTGDRMVVKLAANDLDSTSAKTIGVVYADIAVGQKGIIIIQGLLTGLSILKPSNGWLDGDSVFLDTTGGNITRTKPTAPNHLVYVGTVTTTSSGAAGRMYVRIQNGYELDEIHDVKITSPQTNDYLFYDKTTDPTKPIWKNSASWQGDAIAVTKGGTGLTTVNTGDLLYADDADSIAALNMGATNNVLVSGSAPSWGKVGLATHISGTLPVGNGGTNITSYTIGDLLYANTPTSLAKLQAVDSGRVLISNGVGAAPSWSNSPSLNTLTLTNTGSLTLGTELQYTGQIIFDNNTTSNTLILQSGATSSSYTITLPPAPPSGTQYLQSTSTPGVLQWAAGTTTGLSGVGTIDSVTKNANGGAVSGSNLILQTAGIVSTTFYPGLISTGAQSFQGTKTFTGSGGPIQFSTESVGSFTGPAASATPSAGTRIVIAPGAASNTPLSLGWNTGYEFWLAGRSVISFYPNNVTTSVADFRYTAGTTNTAVGIKGLVLSGGFVAFDPVIDVGSGWIKCISYANNTGAAPAIGTRSSGTRIALVVSGDTGTTLDTALGNMQEGGVGTNYTSMWLSAARDIVFYTNNTATQRFRINSTGLSYNGTKILGSQITGWGTPGGTLTKATIAADVATTPTAAQFNALAQNVRALITDLRTHGLIGT